jgi:hypothetical protein
MATTTNYSWVTPDDTSLVKDGAAAIRTLGSSIDTTTKALNPSTTLGDIEYRSATANTNIRVPVGTTGQVLTVAGGIPSWATAGGGGMTLISTTSLTGVSTVTISSIDQTYRNIQFSIENIGWTGSTGFRVLPNDVTTVKGTAFEGGANGAFTTTLATQANYASPAVFTYVIDNYASSTDRKPFIVYGSCGLDTQFSGGGFFNATTAITSVRFTTTAAGNFTSGSVKVYGIK